MTEAFVTVILFELDGTLSEGGRLHDGVREMLAHLRSAGMRLGVVTGQVTAGQLDLDGWEVVITEDDAGPDGLADALTRMDVPAAGAAYVGDPPGGLEAGRAAGMRVGAALWPTPDPADRAEFLRRVRPLAPEWTFERPADLSRTFATWC